MGVLIGLLVILASLIAYLVHFAHKVNQYWKERGVPHKKPLLFIGNSLNVILGKGGVLTKNRQEVLQMFPNAPVVGYYDFIKPILLVNDMDLVQRVLIKDFSHFNSRGLGAVDHERYPELSNLSNMTGKSWKSLRNKMIPVFTTGKLRLMFEQMSRLSAVLLEGIGSTGGQYLKGLNLKELFNCYSMDIIGAIAFGIDVGTLKDKDNEFARIGRKIFGWRFTVRFLVLYNFPNLSRWLGVGLNSPSITRYYQGIIKQTIDHRVSTGTHRNDFINLMLTLKEKGGLETDKEEGVDDYLNMTDDTLGDNEKVEITETLILSNAFLFIMAGFDNLSNLLTMLCYDLSQDLGAQRRLREEIRKSLKARKGVFNYDVIRDCPYLENCIKETMRLHLLVGTVNRECTKEYTFPGTNVTVKPGDAIEIPSYSIHRNPDIYPEPECFNPDRWSDEVSRPACSWLPFGDGPRICIAMRFVMVEAKCAIAKLLLDYDISLSPKTILPVQQNPRNVLFKTKNPVLFDLHKLNRNL